MDIFQASKEGNLIRVQELIAVGADVNSKDNDGNTSIHNASIESHHDIVNALIIAGADVNSKSNIGNTPLHLASWRGHRTIVNALIIAGADVNSKNDNGYSPLYFASWNGQHDIVNALIAAGADVNIRNNNGKTPLHITSVIGRFAIVNTLITAGANINIRDHYGRTADDVAANDTIKNLIRPPPPIAPIAPLSVRLKQTAYDQYINKEGKDYCGICIEKYEDNVKSIASVNPCNHIYHESCITYWLNTGKTTCPKCRVVITSLTPLIIDTTPGQPSNINYLFGGYYNKLQKYINKLNI